MRVSQDYNGTGNSTTDVNSDHQHHRQHHHISSSSITPGSSSVTILTSTSCAEEEIEVGYNSPSPTPEDIESPDPVAPPSSTIVEKVNIVEKVKPNNKTGKFGLFQSSQKPSFRSIHRTYSGGSQQSTKSSSKRSGGIRIGKTLAGFRSGKSKKNSNNSTTSSQSSSSTNMMEEHTIHTATTTFTMFTGGSTLTSTTSQKTPNAAIASSDQDSNQSNSQINSSQRVLLHSVNNKNARTNRDSLEGIPETNSFSHQKQVNNENIKNTSQNTSASSKTSNPQTPKKNGQIPMEWPKEQYSQQMQEMHDRELMNLEVEQAGRRRQVRERDGFCRRVDNYDGQTITVDGKDAYELGNYLGDGVAGVVYEGTRLLPVEDYPVRTGPIHSSAHESNLTSTVTDQQQQPSTPTQPRLEYEWAPETPPPRKQQQHLQLSPSSMMDMDVPPDHSFDMEETVAVKILNPVGFRLLSPTDANTAIVVQEGEPLSEEINMGLSPMTERNVWWLINPNSRNLRTLLKQPSPNSTSGKTYMDNKDSAIIGQSSTDSYSGSGLTNGNSHRTEYVDRGSANRGLKLSLLAAYKDPKTGSMRELPLTKCIEIWGHAPFGATEEEFEEMMDAIERVNEGKAPLPQTNINSYVTSPSSKTRLSNQKSGVSSSTAPTRVMTADSSAWSEDLSSWSPYPSSAVKQSLYSERSTS